MSRRVGADTLVTTPSDADVHELSGGASAVWADLDEPRTLEELIKRLAEAHTVTADEIGDQVATCIESLVAVGAVEAAESQHA